MSEELEQILPGIVRWMRAKDPLATNYLHVMEAADTLKRYREALEEIAESAPCHCARCTFMGRSARNALSSAGEG